MTVLRSIAYNLWFVLATIGFGLAGIAVRLLAPDRALGFARYWVRALLGGARVICGIHPVVSGLENLPDGPALIASQHQSAYDTLVWVTLVPRPAYVFKKELTRIPLFGPMLRPAGQIPLDRSGSVAAVRALLKEADRAASAGRQIIIFPEGTRVAPGEEAPLRAGVAALAARTRLPVIPVATDSGLRWGRRAFFKRPGPIHIAIGRPLPPGLRSDALLAALREGWRDAAHQFATCG